MAAIRTIREKLGTLVIIVVFVALAAFVLGDLFSSKSILTQPDRSVGEVADTEISFEEFQNKVEEFAAQYQLRTGQTPNEALRASFRNQAWEALVAEKAFGEQYDKVGIEVTEEELIDMVQGNNISPEIRQSFVNPETGEFDRNMLMQYLQNLKNMPPQQQAQWYLFEQTLPDARRRVKYENLLLKTDYITQAEAKREQQSQNAVAEIKYLYVPFASIADSAVQVSDSELENYLEEHSKRYQTEAGRSVQYVSFPISASEEDRQAFGRDIEALQADFANAANDSLYALNNTDGQQAFGTYAPDQLPAQLSNIENLEEGKIYGPYRQGDRYVLYKVSEKTETEESRARASHILIAAGPDASEEEKAEAKNKAQDLLKQLRNGADFGELARENSDDPSAQRGGDLGWFSEGRMVEPFEEAVFGRNDAGLVNNVVETRYGYHLIKVTEPKTNQAYKIATVERDLMPSQQTRDLAYRNAEMFAAEVSSASEFRELANADSLQLRTARNLGANDKRVNDLFEARQVVMWAFSDNTDLGDVSQVFELDDAYVVATLTDKIEKGTASLEDVRDEITLRVKNEKRKEQISEKLNGLNGSLEEMAEAFGSEANVYTASDVKPNAFSLVNIGYAPAVVGTAFGLDAGQRSKPVEAQNGVVIVETLNKTDAVEVADYAAFRNQIEQRRGSRMAYLIAEAVKENADVEDRRYKFF